MSSPYGFITTSCSCGREVEAVIRCSDVHRIAVAQMQLEDKMNEITRQLNDRNLPPTMWKPLHLKLRDLQEHQKQFDALIDMTNELLTLDYVSC